jgi:hypothetical protein
VSDGTPGTIDAALHQRLDATDEELSALEEDQLGLNQGFVKLAEQLNGVQRELVTVKLLLGLVCDKLEIPLDARRVR